MLFRLNFASRLPAGRANLAGNGNLPPSAKSSFTPDIPRKLRPPPTFANNANRIATSPKMTSPVIRTGPLSFPAKTMDPFLFLVYHKDQYPAGNDKMEAPKRGNGADFNPSAPYRMYHGDRIPGFPQHPHRGFETITATLDGIIDHSDSLGCAGRYGQGDLQWMTAGRGIVHGENFPLINKDKPNPTKFFQIWLNLPSKDKMAKPDFVMHWAPDISKIELPGGAGRVIVWAGELEGAKGLPPPTASWAKKPENDVALYHIALQPGGTFTVPGAKGGATTNRAAYFLEGASLDVGGKKLSEHCMATLDAQKEAVFTNAGSDEVELLVMQGKPIGEPVAQHGPFVMNTQDEIRQAFADYQRTQFGGWPWDDDAVVFPADKGRFSLLYGKEDTPSDQ